MKSIRLTVLTPLLAAAVSVLSSAVRAGAERIECEGIYPPHLQGVATDGTNIYWSHTVELVKTDGKGRKLKSSGPVAFHHGDLCWKDGVVYVAVNLGKFNTEDQADSWVYAYRDDDMSFIRRWRLPELVHGAGGITVKNGSFFVVGGLPATHERNYVYEYDRDFKFIGRHVLESGQTKLGIQTVDFHKNRFVFGTYGAKKRKGLKTHGTMVSPADFKSVRFVERDYCGEGIMFFRGRVWRAVIKCVNPGTKGAARRFVSWLVPADEL